MAGEARIQSVLSIRKSVGSIITLNYQRQGSFQADVDGTNGPTPGAVTVAVTGTDISLAQLSVPGLCYLKNLDDENYVVYGVKEPTTTIFYPLGELMPGEEYVLRLSRDLGREYSATGTGTSAGTENTFHMRADTAACVVSIEAFER